MSAHPILLCLGHIQAIIQLHQDVLLVQDTIERGQWLSWTASLFCALKQHGVFNEVLSVRIEWKH